MDLDAPALFVLEGDAYLPTPLAGGPWSPEALHGGPPAALLARAVERFDGGAERFVARMTVELLRPVPFGRLSVDARLVRPGKRAQLVEATLRAGDRDVARALGLRLIRGSVKLPENAPAWESPPVTLPAALSPAPRTRRAPTLFHPGFHTHGVEHRFVHGGFEEPGPAIDWIRLRVPLVEGETTSPLCRVCAAADFGNGVSGMLQGTHTYINPDLTVYLHRYPETEWVCLDAVTLAEPIGVGLAQSLLRDERGVIGRSLQSLIIETR